MIVRLIIGALMIGAVYSVVGIGYSVIYPSTIGVAVNVGCWSHRRGQIVFDRELNASVTTHKGVYL